MSGKADRKPAMEVRSLSFAYGKQKVLRDVSLRMEEGEITTILGANGSGKSTLFALMTKQKETTKGQIFLRGKNVRNLSPKDFAKSVAIVMQSASANADFTVEELVSFGRTPYRKWMQKNTPEDQRLVEWAMEVTGILPYRQREIGQLSGGQRQRVWIAMALAQNTKILFLDEPTTYLDIRYQIEILNLIRQLNQEYGITIVMVLHEINQAIAYSHRVIGIKEGEVLFSGKPEEVICEETMVELYDTELKVHQIKDSNRTAQCIVLPAMRATAYPA
jgi:iron complex transport system ATP-binding protein